jgi:type 1 glutamine amidotransferase
VWKRQTCLWIVAVWAFGACWCSFSDKEGQAAAADGSAKKRVVFLAGPHSHGYGAHEHYAGCVLLAKHLAAGMPDYEVEVFKHEWPSDPKAFEGADCIVMYSDGGGGHPVMKHLPEVDALVAKGVGVVCIHYAVEIPKGEPGDKFVNWIGGYFETDWSVNPHWVAKFEKLPDHPIARGVRPFEIEDEWYYHMRFRPEMKGVTPILTAIPPASTLSRPDGPHSGNPHVRKEVGLPQHVAWASENEQGGRGFGFTGGHDHWNWGNEDFRRVVLNAIVWASHGEVPEHGVGEKRVNLVELQDNQDYPKPENYDWKRAEERISKEGAQK